jgi:hypothetical protein
MDTFQRVSGSCVGEFADLRRRQWTRLGAAALLPVPGDPDQFIAHADVLYSLSGSL